MRIKSNIQRYRPDESLRPAFRSLCRRDPDVRQAFKICDLPPHRRQKQGFAGLMRIITAQQISALAARAIIARLEAACRPLNAETFLSLDDDAIGAIGFSRQKISYGRALAEDVLSGRINFRAVKRMDDEDAIAHLIQAKGIGRWSAEIYLLFSLKRPDIWPAGDLAIQLAVQRLKSIADRPSAGDLRDIGEAWRPHRSAMARFLWHYYHHPGAP